jgi:hypothetical protein
MSVTAHDIQARIAHAATRQIATSDLARAIDSAGLGDQLRALIAQIAANAANPIACDIEDAIEAALTEATKMTEK